MGVVVIHRPVSRYLDDGVTMEVARLATDGSRNVGSFLLGAAARFAFQERNQLRLTTYTLASESGASLRGAGWSREAYDQQWRYITHPDGSAEIEITDVPFPPRDWNRNGRAPSTVTPESRWRWIKLAPAAFDLSITDDENMTAANHLGFAAGMKGARKQSNPFRGDYDHGGAWSDWREGWELGRLEVEERSLALC